MKTKIIIFSALLLSFASLKAQQDSYSKTLKEFLDVSGTTASNKMATDNMLEMYQRQFPEVSPEHWSRLKEIFRDNLSIYFEEKLVPIYKKYLTEEDLIEITNFHKSSAGKKMAESRALMTIEVQKAAIEWGNKVGKLIEQELSKE